jgi:hypothetical protein
MGVLIGFYLWGNVLWVLKATGCRTSLEDAGAAQGVLLLLAGYAQALLDR